MDTEPRYSREEYLSMLLQKPPGKNGYRDNEFRMCDICNNRDGVLIKEYVQLGLFDICYRHQVWLGLRW